MKRLCWLFVSFAWCISGAAGQEPRPSVAPKKPATVDKAQPKFKAIWEPINYPDDLTLMSVCFVNDQVGWVSGGSSWKEGGFILQTKDGGDHWAVQLGDPKSSDSSISNIRCIDPAHAWAIQGNKFVTTSDGQNWEDAGVMTQPGGISTYAFTSPTQGIALTGAAGGSSVISLSKDNGKTWKPVFECATKLEVNGLMQNTGCYLEGLHFPTPSIGYAAGGSFIDGPGTGFVVVAKTEDGGQSWKIIYSATNIPHARSIFFTNANIGFTGNNDGKFYTTTDGGLSWRGVTGTSVNKIQFADAEVGWSGGGRVTRMSFTTDGGMHWNLRDFNFPAKVEDYSLASRQRAYVVSEHGMIYRYRVVPIDYKAKGILDAPMIPAGTPNQGLKN